MWKGSLEGLRLQRIGNKARRNHWFGKSAQNVAIFLARKMGFLSKKDFAGLLSTYTAVLICVEYILNFGLWAPRPTIRRTDFKFIKSRAS